MHVFFFLSVGAIALFSFVSVAVWSDQRRREREAFYRSETIKRIADAQGTGGVSAIEFLREEEMYAMRRRREGQQLGGLITAAAGVGMMVFLYAMPDAHDHNAFFVGLIPLLIGVALLVYSYVLAPKQ